MRQTIYSLLVTAAALFMTFSCSSDDDVIVNGGGSGGPGEGYLTFSLPGINSGSVSYAIATEKETTIANLTVYMFNNDSKLLEKVFRTSDNTVVLGGTASAQTASVNITGRTGKKLFYLLGNGEGRSDDLEDLDVGKTLESEFIEAISNRHETPLAIPLLMTGHTTITAVETPDNTPTELEVKLLRRVARMDVDNNPAVTNFDIKKILVSNANQRVYIFPEAQDTQGKTIETGTYNPIVITPKDIQNPNRMDSVFYLYPTTLGGTHTHISFEGEFNGETKVYNFKPSSEIQLLPNNRYTLRVKTVDVNNADIELRIEDWTAGDDQEGEPQTDLVTFSAVNYSGVKGIVYNSDDNSFDITNVTQAGKVKFSTLSYSAKGTIAETKYTVGSETTLPGLQINAPAPTLTYAPSYTQEYEIDVPVQTGDKKAIFEMVVTVRNEANPDQKSVYTFYSNRYPGTKLYPVEIGGLRWAPVNVGATEIGTANIVKYMGLFYQWGRNNIGFSYASGQSPTDVVAGPASYEDATTGSLADKFITYEPNPWDWLSPQDNTLWGDDNPQGPCPKGWHIAKLTDVEKILNMSDNGEYNEDVVYTAGQGITVKGDHAGESLFIPLAGYRTGNSGNSGNYGAVGYYWLATVDPPLRGTRLEITDDKVKTLPVARRHAHPIRCVQD